jgi:leucyl-tRNA---protein transferase
MQPVLDEHFVSWAQTPEQMDGLWERGWRHFGPIFYRYKEALTSAGLRHVLPLRINVEGFIPSKSQRRVLRKNSDVEIRVKQAQLDDDRQRLFDLHKQRFADNVPNSLEDFLGPAPQAGPCLTVEVGGYLQGKLIAASYLDVGMNSVSSVYAFFHPDHDARCLGTATMMWEIIVARRSKKHWHYPGYCYVEPSGYDYKRRFGPMQCYDWSAWNPLPKRP